MNINNLLTFTSLSLLLLYIFRLD